MLTRAWTEVINKIAFVHIFQNPLDILDNGGPLQVDSVIAGEFMGGMQTVV